MQTTEAKIKQFGFKGGNFTVELELFGKIETIFPNYEIFINPLGNSTRLIEDANLKSFKFKAIVMKSIGFNKIIFKVDSETIIKITDLVCADSRFQIKMEAIAETEDKITVGRKYPVSEYDHDEEGLDKVIDEVV